MTKDYDKDKIRDAIVNPAFSAAFLNIPWVFSHKDVRMWNIANWMLRNVDPIDGDSTVISVNPVFDQCEENVTHPSPPSYFPSTIKESGVFLGILAAGSLISYFVGDWSKLALFLIMWSIITVILATFDYFKRRRTNRDSKICVDNSGKGMFPVDEPLKVVPAEVGEKLLIIVNHVKFNDHAWKIVQSKISGNVDELIEWTEAVHKIIVLKPDFAPTLLPQSASEATVEE